MVTDETRKALLNHLFYEIKMIAEAKRIVLACKLQLGSDPPNMCVVAYLTHLRNLYEFFYGSKNNSNPRAAHYILWEKTPPVELEEIKIKMNLYLSHLSYHRVGKDFKSWDMVWVDHFEELFMEFMENIPKKYLDPSLQVGIKEWKSIQN